MTFTIKANIGGYLKLMNRENNNNIEYHSLTQSVHEREYLYHWDLVNPYHCVGVSPAGSCPQFLTVVDLTENVTKHQYLCLININFFLRFDPPLL